MDVIIVAKTQMSNATCVGAIAQNGTYLRLLDESAHNQPKNTNFEVRQVWDIEFKQPYNITPPHVEDVLVVSKRLKGTLRDEITMLQIVEQYGFTIWRGTPNTLFDGHLQWTENGSCYISEKGEIPKHSVGFWIPDINLTKVIFYNKARYSYHNLHICSRNIPYVGFEYPIDTIPFGTLIRVSLARWWDKNGETEKRCWLQLSGWYELPERQNNPVYEFDGYVPF